HFSFALYRLYYSDFSRLEINRWYAVTRNSSITSLSGYHWLGSILPQMLAMLGGVFVAANTGDSVQKVVSLFIDPNNRFLLVLTYCVGMALFTMVMGNAFAAFPVLSAGIALPFLVLTHQADPAPLFAIGMYAGYCGTLMTPMAA